MKKIFSLIFFLFMNSAFSEQCFDSGREEKIPYLGALHDHRFSPQKTKVLYSEIVSGKMNYFDFKANKLKSIEVEPNTFHTWIDEDHLALIEFPPETAEAVYQKKLEDPDFYLEHIKKLKTTIYNLKTGKKEIKYGTFFEEGNPEEITPVKVEKQNQKKVITYRTSKGRIFSAGLESKKDSIYNDFYGRREITLSSSGELTILEGNKPYFKSQLPAELVHTKKTDNSESDNNYGSYPYNKDYLVNPKVQHNLLIIQTIDNNEGRQTHKHIVIDLKKKKQMVIDLKGHFPNLNGDKENYSQDGSAIVLSAKEESRGSFLYDFNKDEIVKVADDELENPIFNKDNHYCGINRKITSANVYSTLEALASSPPVTYDCFDIKTRKKVSSKFVTDNASSSIARVNEDRFIVNENQGPYRNLPFGGGLYMASNSHSSQESKLVQTKLVCPKKISLEDCDCENINSPKIVFSGINQLSLKIACDSEFNPELWSGLVDNSSHKLNEKDAVVWLKKFSKPGGFSEEDLAVFVGLIDAKAYIKYPDEFKSSLISLYFSSPLLYKSILRQYPQLLELKGKGPSDCLTAEEKTKIKNAKRTLFKDQLTRLQTPSEDALDPILKQAKELLNDEEMDTLAEDIADLAVAKMDTAPELEGIFPSKVYKFVYNKVKSKLGLPYKPVTDVTVVRNNKDIKLKLLGISLTGTSTKSFAGIYVKTTKNIHENNLSIGTTREELSWEHQGKKYSAVIDLKKERTSVDYTPANPAPNYAEMKKQDFRGLIVVGSNMGPQSTENVVQEYLEYYNEEGFDFEEAEEIKSTRNFIQTRISGKDQAHYFVKEAHSDGDEKNLFRIADSGKVLRGVRTLENGKKEYVEIVYPGKDYKTSLLSNNDFGQWMQDREKSGGKELVYLNSSCWSATKATFEIAAAKTPKLINIPTTTLMTTFTNREDNVMHVAIDGLRKEKTYAEMREKMKSDSSYEKRLGNVMIFPDEEDYDKNIRKNSQVSLAIDTHVFTEKNNEKIPYSIEE